MVVFDEMTKKSNVYIVGKWIGGRGVVWSMVDVETLARGLAATFAAAGLAWLLYGLRI